MTTTKEAIIWSVRKESNTFWEQKRHLLGGEIHAKIHISKPRPGKKTKSMHVIFFYSHDKMTTYLLP